jgi:hypothetical protein
MAVIFVIAFALLSAWCVAGFVVAVAVGRAFAKGNETGDDVAATGPESLALSR